jgi:hypothetical protein
MANKEEVKSVVVVGTIIWPFLMRPNNLSEKYQFDLSRLSKTDVKKLESLGLTVKDENKEEPEFDRGKYITVKSKYPITRFTYKDGSEVSEDTLSTVGNETIGKFQISTYESEFNKKKFVGAQLVKGVIHDLVVYEKDGDEESEELYSGLGGDFYDDEVAV